MTVVVGYSAGCFVVPVHNSKTAVERYSTYAYAPDAVCINTLTARLGKVSMRDHKRFLIYAYKCLIVSKLNRPLRYVNASF